MYTHINIYNALITVYSSEYKFSNDLLLVNIINAACTSCNLSRNLFLTFLHL